MYSGFLLLNAVVSIIIAFILALLIPPRFKAQRRFALLLFSTLSITIPLFGLLLSLICLLILWASRKPEQLQSIKEAPIPAFHQQKFEHDIQFGEGGILEALKQKTASHHKRLDALISLNQLEKGATNQVNHALLQDKNDDIRLFAFNKLALRENDINQKLNTLRALLPLADAKPTKAKLEKWVAELYWDLVYLNLASGDLTTVLLNKAKKHAENSASLNEISPAPHILLGKIALYTKQYDQAEAHFKQAKQLNAPDIKVIPFLVEINFIGKRYQKVSELLSSSDSLHDTQRLEPIIDLWCHND